MPAVTLAGALALAGCGGSETKTVTETEPVEHLLAKGGYWYDPRTNKLYECTADDGCTITFDEDRRIVFNEDEVTVSTPEDPDAEMARKDAAALYTALSKSGGVIHPISTANLDAFNKAKGEKHHQKMMQEGDPFEDVADGEGNATAMTGNPKGAYTIADRTTSNGTGNLARGEATAPVFAPGPSVVKHDVPDGGAGVFTTSGEWMGVSGTFYCTTGCESQNGHPIGSNWRFKPGNVKDKVTAKDIAWGWWINTGTNDEITGITLFNDPGGLTKTTADLTDNNGSATYEGDATGKYAVPGEAGHFTAKAMLTAKFGPNMLSGEIKDFKDADGKDKAGWSVTLKDTTLTYDNTNPDATGKTVWTRDGGKGAEGDWHADLYGGTNTKVSTNALGSFKAKHQGSYMAGAFGTEKTGEAPE